MSYRDPRRERGQVVVIFALLVPVVLALGAIVIAVGNWYTHGKHLQTKADAGVFAGGGVWSFPCVEDGTQGTTSQRILDTARQFVGAHTQADGTPYTGSTFNPQVGNVPGSRIHAVVNGSEWFDDDSNTLPIELNDPVNPSVCNSMTLDLKLTEDNSFPLFSLVPLFPDIKRKARVQIEQVEGVTGLLPVAVRIPKPLSMAAVFYDESNGDLLDVKYICETSGNFGGALPAGLGAWTSLDTGINPNPLCTSWASFNVPSTAGVAIATSTRPACDAPNPPTPPGNWGVCMNDNPTGVATVDDFCRQPGAGGTIKCFYATGPGSSQTVHSGLQFIHGYGTGTVTDGPPEVRSVWFDSPPLGCGSYFSVTASTCSALLHADIDFGAALDQTQHPGAAADVKYGLVYGTTSRNGDQCLDGQNRPNCDMNPSWTANVTFDPRYDNQGDPAALRHAIALRVRLTRTTIGPPGPGQITCPNFPGPQCQWFFTAQGRTTVLPTRDQMFQYPLQRHFTGDDTNSGPVKWLRLSSGTGASCTPQYIDGEAASQPGQACFFVELGLRGALATDQDEDPIAFNFKGSQSGSVDCDDSYPNWRTEVENTCRPYYAANDFARTPSTSPTGPCPWPSGSAVSWNTFMNPPSPYDAEWPAYTCLRTDGPPAPGQVAQGLFNRMTLLGNPNNAICPPDSATDFVPGRNYWDDSNNQSGGTYAFADLGVHPNNLESPDVDKRLVTLFLTTYDSFGGTGGAVYPIVGFADFYITGWGKGTGGNLTIDDPCPGNDPPPDIPITPGQSGAQFIWGHFVNAVRPAPFTTGGTGVLCQPGTSFQPCVAVLVD